jgi:hypothetical protein
MAPASDRCAPDARSGSRSGTAEPQRVRRGDRR